MLLLADPDVRFHRSYLEALDEWGGAHRDGDGELVRSADAAYPGHHFTREGLEDPAEFARLVDLRLADREPGAPRPEGFVPCTFLWITDDARPDDYIGSLAIRHRLNDFLEKYGGHIGYSVRPAARRRGIATRALGLALPVAAGLGVDPALLTCDDDNTGSIAVIEAHGGALEDRRTAPDGTVKRRYWVPTSPAFD